MEKILIFTNRDLASNYHLNLLLPHIAQDVKAIFLTDKVGKKNNQEPPETLKTLRFFEQTMPNAFLFPLLENQKEIKGAKLLTFNNLALKYHIPIYSCNDVKSAENLAWIRSFAPDLVLSIRFGKIFPDAFLKIPKLGVLNLHSGLLPNYRGVLAVFRALQNGDALIQATLHFIDDATIDTGRIVGFSTLAVSPNRSLLWHILNLYPQTIDLTLATIRALKEGSNISTFTQSAHQAAYYTFPTVAELEAFVAEGWKIVDVSEIESFYAMYKPD